MSPELSAERCRQGLRNHRGRLAEAARVAGSGASVPTCPDWTVTELVGHVGQTLHWVSKIVERRVADPSGLRTARRARGLAGVAVRRRRPRGRRFSDEALEAAVWIASGDSWTGA